MRQAYTPMEIAAAENLRRIFENKKYGPERLTQKKLADLVGFKQQTAVSQYLSGRNTLGVEAIANFAAALKVPPEEIRPDFYDLLQLTQHQTPVRSIPVTAALSGATPSVRVITTIIEKNEAAVTQYAILVDKDTYRKARIRQNAHLIIDDGLAPQPDDDVYVVTAGGERYIGTVLALDDNDISFTSLADNKPVALPRDFIKTLGVIAGVQNPKRQ